MTFAVPPPGKPLDLVGLGQNSVDHQVRLADFPTAGEKVAARSYKLLPGGQVATAVLAGQRLGLGCAYLGAVGDDDLAPLACRDLEREGVAVHLRRVEGGRTQMSTNLVTADGERTLFEHYDPRVLVRAEDLEGQRELIQSARALHLDITDLPAALKAARWAQESGAFVSLDIDRLLPGVEELFPLVDLFVAAAELPDLLGFSDPVRALEQLRQRCPGVVAMTMGERGCMMWAPGEAAPECFPAFQVEAVDTTGCGDVFRGALLAALTGQAQLVGTLVP